MIVGWIKLKLNGADELLLAEVLGTAENRDDPESSTSQTWRRQTDAEDTDADGIPYEVMDSAACTRRYKDLLETLRINDLPNGQIYDKIKKSVSGLWLVEEAAI